MSNDETSLALLSQWHGPQTSKAHAFQVAGLPHLHFVVFGGKGGVLVLQGFEVLSACGQSSSSIADASTVQGAKLVTQLVVCLRTPKGGSIEENVGVVRWGGGSRQVIAAAVGYHVYLLAVDQHFESIFAGPSCRSGRAPHSPEYEQLASLRHRHTIIALDWTQTADGLLCADSKGHISMTRFIEEDNGEGCCTYRLEDYWSGSAPTAQHLVAAGFDTDAPAASAAAGESKTALVWWPQLECQAPGMGDTAQKQKVQVHPEELRHPSSVTCLQWSPGMLTSTSFGPVEDGPEGSSTAGGPSAYSTPALMTVTADGAIRVWVEVAIAGMMSSSGAPPRSSHFCVTLVVEVPQRNPSMPRSLQACWADPVGSILPTAHWSGVLSKVLWLAAYVSEGEGKRGSGGGCNLTLWAVERLTSICGVPSNMMHKQRPPRAVLWGTTHVSGTPQDTPRGDVCCTLSCFVSCDEEVPTVAMYRSHDSGNEVQYYKLNTVQEPHSPLVSKSLLSLQESSIFKTLYHTSAITQLTLHPWRDLALTIDSIGTVLLWQSCPLFPLAAIRDVGSDCYDAADLGSFHAAAWVATDGKTHPDVEGEVCIFGGPRGLKFFHLEQRLLQGDCEPSPWHGAAVLLILDVPSSCTRVKQLATVDRRETASRVKQRHKQNLEVEVISWLLVKDSNPPDSEPSVGRDMLLIWSVVGDITLSCQLKSTLDLQSIISGPVSSMSVVQHNSFVAVGSITDGVVLVPLAPEGAPPPGPSGALAGPVTRLDCGPRPTAGDTTSSQEYTAMCHPVALCTSPCGSYVAAAVVDASGATDAVLIWQSESSSGGQLTYSLEAAVQLPDTPTAISWLDVYLVVPCVAVACSGHGVVVLSRQACGSWAELAHFSGCNVSITILAMSHSALIIAAAGERLLQVAVEYKSASGSDSPPASMLHNMIQKGLWPLYHPASVAVLVARSRIDAVASIVATLAQFLDETQGATATSTDFADGEEATESGDGSRASAIRASRSYPEVQLGDVVDQTWLAGARKVLQEETMASRSAGSGGTVMAASAVETGVLDMSTFGMTSVDEERHIMTSVTHTVGLSSGPSANAMALQDSGMIDLSSFGMGDVSVGQSHGPDATALSTGQVDMSAFGLPSFSEPEPPAAQASTSAQVASGQLDMSAFGLSSFGSTAPASPPAPTATTSQVASGQVDMSAFDLPSFRESEAPATQSDATSELASGQLDMSAFGLPSFTESEPPAPQPPATSQVATGQLDMSAFGLPSFSESEPPAPQPPATSQVASGQLDMSAFGLPSFDQPSTTSPLPSLSHASPSSNQQGGSSPSANNAASPNGSSWSPKKPPLPSPQHSGFLHPDALSDRRRSTPASTSYHQEISLPSTKQRRTNKYLSTELLKEVKRLLGYKQPKSEDAPMAKYSYNLKEEEGKGKEDDETEGVRELPGLTVEETVALIKLAEVVQEKESGGSGRSGGGNQLDEASERALLLLKLAPLSRPSAASVPPATSSATRPTGYSSSISSPVPWQPVPSSSVASFTGPSVLSFGNMTKMPTAAVLNPAGLPSRSALPASDREASWCQTAGLLPGLSMCAVMWALLGSSQQQLMAEAAEAVKDEPSVSQPTSATSSGVMWTRGDASRAVASSTAGQLSWPALRAAGAGFWLTDAQLLKETAEKLAKWQFSQRRDPHDCALLYIAIGKKSVLQGLFRTTGNVKIADFLRRDFGEDKQQHAAKKNAFVLLGQHRYDLAAAFFVLGGAYKDAAGVCLHDLGDPQLALMLCRLLGGPLGQLECEFITTELLPTAHKSADSWAEATLHWLLGDYSTAIHHLIPRMSSPAETEGLHPQERTQALDFVLYCMCDTDISAALRTPSRSLHSPAPTLPSPVLDSSMVDALAADAAHWLSVFGLPALALEAVQVADMAGEGSAGELVGGVREELLLRFSLGAILSALRGFESLMCPVEGGHTGKDEEYKIQAGQQLKSLKAAGIGVDVSKALHVLDNLEHILNPAHPPMSLPSTRAATPSPMSPNRSQVSLSHLFAKLFRHKSRGSKALAPPPPPLDSSLFGESCTLFRVDGDRLYGLCCSPPDVHLTLGNRGSQSGGSPLGAGYTPGPMLCVATGHHGLMEGEVQPPSEEKESEMSSEGSNGRSSAFVSLLYDMMETSKWQRDPWLLPLSDFPDYMEPDSSGTHISSDEVVTSALDAHPNRALYLTGSTSGHVLLWSYQHKMSLSTFTPAVKYGVEDESPVAWFRSFSMGAAARTPGIPVGWGFPMSVKFSSCGERFAGVGDGGLVATWRLNYGQHNSSAVPADWCQQGLMKKGCDVVYVAGSSSILAVGGQCSQGGNIAIWDTLAPSRSACIARLAYHQSAVTRLHMLPGDVLMASGDEYGGVAVKDLRMLGGDKTGKVVWRVDGAHHKSTVTSMTGGIHPRQSGKSVLVTGGKDGSITTWSVEHGTPLHTMEAQHTVAKKPTGAAKTGVADSLAAFRHGGGVAVTGLKVVERGVLSCGLDGTVQYHPFIV